MAAGDQPWQLWVDTGGTFTDCIAVDPGGGRHRCKVLSSSRLRDRVGGRDGRRVSLALAGAGPRGLLRGYALRPLGPAAAAIEIVDSDPERSSVRLAAEPPPELQPGAPCEIVSPEEAPLLAARWITGTRLDEPLPALRLRLATTRGTNALLERDGAPTALFTTRGFADLLAIGSQQRPDLFARQICKPAPLYAAVVEVAERLAADGGELVPLEPAALEAAAGDLVAAGVRTAAVALLHADREPRHERRVAALLERLGFTHVSQSAELAPFVGVVARAETAVVNAYLSQAVGAYLEALERALGPGRMQVMTSAGGLAGAAGYRPKDSLLSGPAGGVVGAAEAGRRSGFERVIAFDMGGTSTDVSRHDRGADYRFETRVGDVRLLAPALAIETVAAGGGSICRFDGRRLRVGPESAGASPGPACYGAGGPLTLTDVNLLLGRLDAGGFEIPLDAGAAARAAAALLDEVAAAGAGGDDRDRLLAGALRIANERMAEAVRRVSIREGHRPAEFTLVAFGGAGPQHACVLAEQLGVGICLVPPQAGLLSAAGLGAARLERFAERQVLEPLAELAGRVGGLLAELEATARDALRREGVAAAEVEIVRRLAELRLAGQDATIAVELAEPPDPGPAFARAYREQYGYPPPPRPVELVALRVVARQRSAPPPPAVARVEGRVAPPAESRRAWFGGRWRDAPVWRRERLRPGDRLAGPGVVFERHSATVLEPGWRAEVDAAGALVLRRRPGPDAAG